MIPPGRIGWVVPSPQMEPDAYMEAFMNGFEFVLLAIRGRLAEEKLPPEERRRLEVFLADYSKIAEAYRARRPAPGTPGLAIHGRIAADVALATPN